MSQTESAVPDYDRLWKEVYGDIQDVGPVHQHMKRLLRRLLSRIDYASVLDVGVGFGHNLPLLTEGRKLKQVAGIDFSQVALEHVRERYDGDFVECDVEAGHLQETFDLVFSALVMEHVKDDRAVLKNMRAMTSKHLVLVTIAGDFERYRPWEDQMGHLRNYRRGELESKLDDAGFNVQSSIYWGWPLYTPIVRTLQNRMTASNEFGPGTRAIAKVLNFAYFANSSKRGDLLIVHATAK